MLLGFHFHTVDAAKKYVNFRSKDFESLNKCSQSGAVCDTPPKPQTTLPSGAPSRCKVHAGSPSEAVHFGREQTQTTGGGWGETCSCREQPGFTEPPTLLPCYCSGPQLRVLLLLVLSNVPVSISVWACLGPLMSTGSVCSHRQERLTSPLQTNTAPGPRKLSHLLPQTHRSHQPDRTHHSLG